MLTFVEWIKLQETRQGREGKNRKDYNHGKNGWVGQNMRYSGKQGKGHSFDTRKNRIFDKRQTNQELEQDD